MMVRKTGICLLSLIIAISMMPSFSFATDQDTVETEEQDAIVTDEQAPAGNDEQTSADEQTAETAPVNGEEGTSVKAQSYSFKDDGTAYKMEDTSGYTSEMKVYAIFMHRDSGTWNSSDRYGDAVLIESNGKYLLMDTGTNTPVKNSDAVYTSSLVRTLKNIGVKNLDIYISHMHGDHTGGLEDLCDEFDVEHVFLPDIETCRYYETPNTGKTIDEIYKDKTKIAKDENADVIYLTPSFRTPRAKNSVNKFNVGAAVCTVIGPVGTYKPSDFASQDGDCGTKEGHCLNNCSLSTIIQCGNVRYITTGDIEKQEETELVSRYGSGLDADVMKMNHHGLRTSNTSGFLARVTPLLSFEESHGYVSSISASVSRAKQYGYNVSVAAARYNFVIAINNNAIRIYRDSNGNGIKDQGPVTGWLSVDGKYQYYGSTGQLFRNWDRIGSDYYYFSESSAFRYTGTHTIHGKKCEFSSTGALKSPTRSARVTQNTPKALKGHKIKVSWAKASGSSRYVVYRSTKKASGYVPVANLSSKSRSYMDKGLQNGGNGLVKGNRYYYKVRGYRYTAGAELYGPYSKVKSERAR